MKNRETILLVLVALIGLGGLAVLQFSGRRDAAAAEERSLVQAASEKQNTDASKTEALQKIPGNLVSWNEQPEAGRPFLFKMANFAQGAVYELDLGDGTRKPFTDGVIRHTYHRPGKFHVRLIARYQGQEAVLEEGDKIVAQTVQKEEVAPIIDY